jgi:hypothetical protein
MPWSRSRPSSASNLALGTGLVFARFSRPVSPRRLHVLGTGAAILLLPAAIVPMRPWLLPAAVAVGYAVARLGHAVFERNKPAAFCPLRPLVGNVRMFVLAVSGRR